MISDMDYFCKRLLILLAILKFKKKYTDTVPSASRLLDKCDVCFQLSYGVILLPDAAIIENQ